MKLKDGFLSRRRFLATRCVDDLEKHFEESVLLKLPENYQSVLKQSLISEVDDMVPQPHLDTFVVGRSKKFVSLNQYEEGESPRPLRWSAVIFTSYVTRL